jgi:hypothetical protein
MDEEDKILVESKELDLGILYSYVFSKEDARSIIDNEDEFMIEISNGKVYFRESTIEIRTTGGSGLGTFDKKKILNQIKLQLA